MIFRPASLALGILLLVGGITPVAGQSSPSPEALQAAKELASLVSRGTMGELMTNMNNQLWPSVEADVRRSNPSIDAATLGEIRQAIERVQMAFVDGILNEAPNVYVRHFTVQEMRDILAFYKTPAGAKALTEMPKLTAELLSGLAPRMQTLQRDLAVAITEVLQRKGYGQK
jgi:hypothetical protein